MRPVGVKVLEDVEINLPAIGVEPVDKFAATLYQSLEVLAVSLRACHLMLPYEVANFATKPSSEALPRIWLSGMSR